MEVEGSNPARAPCNTCCGDTKALRASSACNTCVWQHKALCAFLLDHQSLCLLPAARNADGSRECRRCCTSISRVRVPFRSRSVPVPFLVLRSGRRSLQTIRAAQGLQTILQPGQLYAKGRTALAERSIQTVRAQGKCLMVHIQDKMKVKFPAEHPPRAWAIIHGAWLLNRFHVSSPTATTAFMSLRGRPYRGRVCAFGEEAFALDPLQAKYSTQWRRGIWLTKD